MRADRRKPWARLLGTIPALLCLSLAAMSSFGAEAIKLITLDPGHFHAALVQKFMYPQVSPTVNVYAPEGHDLQDHLKRIEAFNSRVERPTTWREKVYTGADFLNRMVRERPGNVVILAGNNTRKTRYIYKSISAGFNVLADKPMAINPADFRLLQKAFKHTAIKRVLLYDIMTERFEITTVLQRELARMPEVFGTLQPGTFERPAVEMESVHYFLKEVDGRPLIRPGWFFDVRQEGEAIPDVGTHLVDLVQWQCFPEQSIDWKKDIQVQSARRWSTSLTREQFKRVTNLDQFPDFVKSDVTADGLLQVYGNGEVRYKLRGTQIKVTALWNFEADPGARDTHFSVLRGSRSNLYIKQTAKEGYEATVYIEKACNLTDEAYGMALHAAVEKLASRWPGLEVVRAGEHWKLNIPPRYRVGHEAHFSEVTSRFLEYLQEGKLPVWETPCMLAKYYTTTEAYRLSHAVK